MSDPVSAASADPSTPTSNVITASNSGTSVFADFASDFGVKIEIEQPTEASAQSPQTTPAPRRSASQMSGSSATPEMPDNKRARSRTGDVISITAPNMSPSGASPQSLKGYNNRKNAGVVAKAMGMRKPLQALPEGTERKFSKVEVLSNVQFDKFHFMHSPLEMRANGLDLQTQYVMDALIKKYNLQDIDPIGPTSQDTQVHIGRICCESAEGKLNAKSVMLEGSLGLSAGRRIKLDLSKISEYALFPGQIVAVEGNNAGDGAFIVRKLYQGAPAPLATRTPEQLEQFKAANDGQPTVIWSAAGPYTTLDNMSYQPLADLFAQLTSAAVAPDVLVLMGPFVSVNHPVVRTGHITEETDDGEINLTFEECFRLYIAEPILGFFLDNPSIKTTIVLAPSLFDAHHTFCFPQPAFAKTLFQYDDDDTDLVKDGRVVLLSNPATFRVNGVTVALTSTDVVADTMTEQIARSGPHKVNRFQRVLQHILSQRNMYPVFPANRRVPLDCGRLKAARFADGGKTAPDILLLRSKLTYFIQNVFGTVCVNSGPLSKGSAGGLFTRIQVFPPSKRDSKDAASQPDEIVNRASIEVVRI